MHLPNGLLPGPTRLRLTPLTATTERIILAITATQPAARCPTGAAEATHIQSHDRRTVADRPWARLPVQLHRHDSARGSPRATGCPPAPPRGCAWRGVLQCPHGQRHTPAAWTNGRSAKARTTTPSWSIGPRIVQLTCAAGAAQGAPEAVQVADRVHFMQNLRAALDPIRDRLRAARQAAAALLADAALATSPRQTPAVGEPDAAHVDCD